MRHVHCAVGPDRKSSLTGSLSPTFSDQAHHPLFTGTMQLRKEIKPPQQRETPRTSQGTDILRNVQCFGDVLRNVLRVDEVTLATF